MSIATKTGDDGTTALMYGRRVPKTHLRVEACGAVDELNAALGLARAAAPAGLLADRLLAIQQDLIILMGEISVAMEDLPRYFKDGFSTVTPAMTARLDALVSAAEAGQRAFGDWVMPGATPAGAALDMARTICRRAERCVCRLKEAGELKNAEIIVYLNRLSDLLWLFARGIEANSRAPSS